MKHVGVFRLSFPEVSETFIRAQLGSYERYSPLVIARRKLGETDWPVCAVSDFGRNAERLHLLTRSPEWHVKNLRVSPDLLHAHFGVDGVYALPLSNALNVPLVVTFHGFDILTRRSWWYSHPSIPIAHYLMHFDALKRGVGKAVAVSGFVESALLDAGFPPEKVIRHYIGVDTNRFTVGTRSVSNERYVLCVGRHVEFKGIDTLLRAFSSLKDRHPSVSLKLVGAGPLTGDLMRLASSLGIEGRVQFLGAKPHGEVLALMQAAEVFALPSVTQQSGQAEALGIVFNEASACGLPIVATRSGGIPEVVLHGETGLLCPERDWRSLAENLDILLSDRALAQRMGLQGRDLVCESFNLKKQTTALENIYDQLLQ